MKLLTTSSSIFIVLVAAQTQPEGYSNTLILASQLSDGQVQVPTAPVDVSHSSVSAIVTANPSTRFVLSSFAWLQTPPLIGEICLLSLDQFWCYVLMYLFTSSTGELVWGTSPDTNN